jgi:predicted membrane-bound dolichyl-phosphate-mannose-protein mannosyltransferase
MLQLAELGPERFAAAAPNALFQPGLLWVLWFSGHLAGLLAAITGHASAEIAPYLVKLPASLADIGVGASVYAIATRLADRRSGLVAASLFLVLPVSWYISAVWGQVDSIGALLFVLALLLVMSGWSEAALVTAGLAALVKPQLLLAVVVIGLVLSRRHLLAPGTGPTSSIPRRLREAAPSVTSWFTDRQGPERLVAAVALTAVLALLLVAPFRLGQYVPGPIGAVPVVADVAGLIKMISDELARFPVVTANAFNPWAFVGSPSLVLEVGHWNGDDAAFLAGVPARTVGLAALFGSVVLGGAFLIRREEPRTLVLITTLLALAVFVLPTRAHERYLLTAFAVAAPLAALSAGWFVWYVAGSAAALINLHGVLTLPSQSGTAALVALPFGGLARSSWLVALAALTFAGFFTFSLARVVGPVRSKAAETYRAIDDRWPLRNLIPDAGTALLIVLAISLLLRAAWLNLPQGALIFDEAYYVNASRVMIGIHPPAGAHYADSPLFIDPNSEHPPLGKALIAASILFFGDNGLGWRVPSVAAAIVALFAVYGIVRALRGRPWLAVLATGLYSLDVLSFVHGRIGTLDMMSLAFLLLGAWLALRKDWLLAGGALALGTLVKVPGVYGFAAVFAWQLWALWRISRTRRVIRDDLVPLAALTGAYAFVGFAGLWLLDLRFTTYTTPLDHINRMLSYGFALQGGFSPSGITSAPWQWLVNDGQFDYLKTSVNTLVNGQVTGSRTVIQFRAMLNPVLIGSATIGGLYAAWLSLRRGEPIASFGLLWIAANYLPYFPLVLLSHRISYFYYIVPAVPGLALVLAATLVHSRLPRAVVVGFAVVTVLAFIANFPFKEIPA